MTVATSASAIQIFSSRLTTLEHLLGAAVKHFPEGDQSWLRKRLADDMFPMGAQVAFVCTQPHNFALWVKGAPASNLDPNIETLAAAHKCIQETKSALASLDSANELPSTKHLELPGGLYADLTGEQYINDFLLPNFYFHLVTAYGILRMAGMPIGKRDYMTHLAPFVRLAPAKA